MQNFVIVISVELIKLVYLLKLERFFFLTLEFYLEFRNLRLLALNFIIQFDYLDVAFPSLQWLFQRELKL